MWIFGAAAVIGFVYAGRQLLTDQADLVVYEDEYLVRMKLSVVGIVRMMEKDIAFAQRVKHCDDQIQRRIKKQIQKIRMGAPFDLAQDRQRTASLRSRSANQAIYPA